MIRLNILDMKVFLQTVNACSGAVHLLCPDGGKKNITRQPEIQNELLQKHRENKNCLPLSLEIPNPGDYISVVSYYAGDC